MSNVSEVKKIEIKIVHHMCSYSCILISSYTYDLLEEGCIDDVCSVIDHR